MPIETSFKFAQFTPAETAPQNLTPQILTTEKLTIPAGEISEANLPHLPFPIFLLDKLGPLRGFVGSATQKTWTGSGFNMLWRPNFGGKSGPQDFFLELNLTTETLSFTDITGSGVANRGHNQADIALGALSYLQEISDVKLGPQHFEPGLWLCAPATTAPNEPVTVTRMGSIPHGTTIHMQGLGVTVTGQPPHFDVASIVPFSVGAKDDGHTSLQPFPAQTTNVQTLNSSRTPPANVPGLDDAHLQNPNLFLQDGLKGLTVVSMVVLTVTSEVKSTLTLPDVTPASPDVGGGTDSIAFLAAKAPNGNATPGRVTSTFWLETVKDSTGKEFPQLQYTQRVLLNFNGLSWPHVSVGTLR